MVVFFAGAKKEFADLYNSGKMKKGETYRVNFSTSPDKIGFNEYLEAHIKGLRDQSFWTGEMVYEMEFKANKLFVHVMDKHSIALDVSRDDNMKRGDSPTPLNPSIMNVYFNYEWDR